MKESFEEAANAARLAKSDVALVRRVSGDVYRRSTFHRARLDRAGLGKRGVKSVDDLGKLPPMRLDDVNAVSNLLLIGKPSKSRRYGAIRWASHEDKPLAYSSQDLGRLAESGAQVLQRAGLRVGDVILDVAGGCSSRDQIQLRSGARKAGFPLVSVPGGTDPEITVAVDASVVAGSADSVTAALDAVARCGRDHRIHTAIVAGDPLEVDTRLATAASLTAVTVVRMWAPPGVLAAWSECRGGKGFHTYPDDELVEIVDDVSGLPVLDGYEGTVLWTGTRWYATALVRLQTSAFGILETKQCADCRRVSPRFVPQTERSSFCDLLDAHEEVAAWAAELHRTFKGDELSIWIAPSEGSSSLSVLTAISARIGSARVHVVDRSEVDAIVEASNGERYGDRRAFASEDSGTVKNDSS